MSVQELNSAELDSDRGSSQPPTGLDRLRAFIGIEDRVLGKFLIAILCLYVAKQVITVLVFPPFTGHDEVAHLAYVETVVNEHRVPVVGEDEIPDYFYRYCQFILDWSPCEPENERWLSQPFRFADWGNLGVHAAGEQYAANHPPLYYLVAAPILRLSESASPETQQYLLRTLAIPFGAFVVLLGFLTAVTLFPGDRFIPIVTASVIAFQTQISYEAAMVNNDILGIAALSLIVYLLVKGIRSGFQLDVCIATGVAFGLALITKGNLVVAGPVIALAVILTVGLRQVGAWVGRGSIMVAVAAMVSAPWYAYMYRTYGNFTAVEQIKEIQEPWNKPAGSFTDLLWNLAFVRNRWRETWGAFGWRRIQLDDWLLQIIMIPFFLALAGLVVYVVISLRKGDGQLVRWFKGYERPDREQVVGLLVMIATFFVSYVAVIQFGTDFVLTQARYFFPAIVAIVIPLAVGARTLIPVRHQPLAQALILAAVVFLNVFIYTKYVIPYWHYTTW